MNANDEVLRQIQESKGVGNYLLSNFTKKSNGVFNETPGFINSVGYVNQQNIDSDSFLKNLHIKNSNKIVYNHLDKKVIFKPEIINSRPVDVQTRSSRGCKTEQDITSRHYYVNIKNAQEHINYNVGIDSRHQKR